MSRIILALLVIGLTSCASTKNFTEAEKRAIKVKIKGEYLSERERALINQALNRLPYRFKKSIKIVHVRNDIKHFMIPNITAVSFAHACKDVRRKVCISTPYLCKEIVWHEVAHIYTGTSNEFTREWIAIAGAVYGQYPDKVAVQNGLLTIYSRNNYREDIAEWIEECYTHLYLSSSESALKGANLKADTRYRKKLALLYKYRFFSKEQYDKLKPLFEPK